jgi:hypothetical protein
MSAMRAFGSDAAMALAVINEARYLVLRRYFGISREQANVLTAVVVFAGADAAYATMRHAVQSPLGVTGADATLGALVLRELGYSFAGPGAREVPFFGALVAAGVLGGLALPSVREGLRHLRRTERRIREHRLRVYNTGRRAER